MGPSWLNRYALVAHPLWVRLLVLVLSVECLGAGVGSLIFMGSILRLSEAPRVPITMWLMACAVFFLATVGYATLVRVHRWVGMLLLLSAAVLGGFLLYWAFWAAVLLGVIYEG